MLIGAVVIFTLVALLGVLLAVDTYKKRMSSTFAKIAHIGLAVIGAVLVIIAAIGGDGRVWINIVLAVAIVILGVLLAYRRSKGELPKNLLACHGGLAVICYLVLAYYAFVPHA